MKANEIRVRVHSAIGEPRYPAGLADRLARRINNPVRPIQPRAYGLIAAILALLVIGVLVFTRLATSLPLGFRPEPGFQPNATPGPVSPGGQLPGMDLDNTQLGGNGADLVTRLNMTADSNGHKVTMIGAYADHARVVLFFRSNPAAAAMHAEVYDTTGLLNYGSTSGRGSYGDTFIVLMGAAHPAANGLAHLDVGVDGFTTENGGSGTSGTWNFSFSVPVQTPTPLELSPSLTSVGPWKVRLEAIEVTPTVVHFQAVIDNGALADMIGSPVTLVDSNGQEVQGLSSYAESTAPKGQPPAASYTQFRFYMTWVRPAPGSYDLHINVPAGQYSGRLVIPEFVPSIVRKGSPLQPSNFPTSKESITINGAISAAIQEGNSSECGSGAGESTPPIYAFATWFEFDHAWYLLAVSTDPAVRAYSGPGTYTADARLYPYAPYGADPIFAGKVQLTVTSDKGQNAGSIRGSMSWIQSSSPGSTLTVAGSWRCTPGPNLGPG